jgi:hypothetical protein
MKKISFIILAALFSIQGYAQDTKKDNTYPTSITDLIDCFNNVNTAHPEPYFIKNGYKYLEGKVKRDTVAKVYNSTTNTDKMSFQKVKGKAYALAFFTTSKAEARKIVVTLAPNGYGIVKSNQNDTIAVYRYIGPEFTVYYGFRKTQKEKGNTEYSFNLYKNK